jgi:hypothetical protein
MNLGGEASKKASLFLTVLPVCSLILRNWMREFCLEEDIILNSARTLLCCKMPARISSIAW